MRKLYLLIFIAVLCTCLTNSCKTVKNNDAPVMVSEAGEGEEEENDKYDGPAQRDSQEFRQTQDPALGYVPYERLKAAIDYTRDLQNPRYAQNSPLSSTILWQPRGPVYDSVGPSGNPRGGGGYTSGRIAAVLIDTLNDPSGNTALVGGISGGVWKCTNFLSDIPNWRIVNDYFGNMAISYLVQDPSSPSVIYFSTGEATANADAHFGLGIWKSTDKGETFTQLPSTVNYNRTYKMVCDVAGNLYIGERPSNTYGAVIPTAPQLAGLLRSNDKGVTWTDITPTNLTSTNKACNDLEISSTGRLHASFGYVAAGAAIVNHRYTDNPATVTAAAGWNISTGIKLTATCVRMELACLVDTLYAVTVNNAGNSDSCYKSINGGVTWTKQNTVVMPTGVLNGQGWYNETLNINPANSSEIMCGGLDAYRSTNSGTTWVRTTFWVTTAPYVHADHHFQQWWKAGGESRMVIGCDGGIFMSRDNGVTWKDKNRNLSLKQFYCAAIHPAAGSPYLIAGAQDNGTHQITTTGLTYSKEVIGGDGMYCYIDQVDPNIQFGAYVNSNYYRSLNGGQTWIQIAASGTGLFTNPYDYDDVSNTFYGCFSANNLFRILNANTATVSTTVPVALLNGQASAVKVSLNTANRVFLGGTTGRVIKLDNATSATPVITNITGATFPAGNINCVNTGSTDNNLVATFTNYGLKHVWATTDGGTNWTNIDGNMPDMPVWWALYDPTNNSRMLIGTETGIWTTDNINGASTVWSPDPGFPLTRVSMLRIRASDRTVVAASYGRGLFTGVLSNTTAPEVSFVTPTTIVKEQTAVTTGCRNYQDYVVNLGITNTPVGAATVTVNVNAGATATRGVDYDFTTNGDFTNPSSQFVFADGSLPGSKVITVRVYDDAEVEPTESFTFSFAISGTTNAVPGSVLNHVFTIQDNDAYPITPFTVGNFALGTYNSDIIGGVSPFNAAVIKHKIQVLYTAAELQAAGVSLTAAINSLTLRVVTKLTTVPFKGFTISMANTGNANLAAGFVPEGVNQVYSADYTTVVGNNTFNFQTPFVWDGFSNVAVQFCWDNSAATVDGVVDVVEGNAAPLGATVRATTFANFTTGTVAGCSLPAAFVSFTRINATFGASFGIQVATALNATKTEHLGDKNDLFYYTPAGELLARVLNLSSQTYGCTQVLIDRAGTGTTQFWNTNTANYLMNKTYRIIPTTNSTTGKYEVTFYFTKAEKEGWEAATGKIWDSIQIIKLPSRISNVTPANAQPDGPGTIQVINAVKRTFGPNYYTLSAIFENGFSGFGFGVPGRMNTILALTGAINANNVDIDLNWTTSAEINSTVFEVEKSYDNVTFHKIGTVAASGNKLTPSSYPFTDHENVQNNYYRIKMLHSDGYVLYSNTIYIKKDGPQHIFILNNPFTNQINIRFGQTPTGPVVFSLYDAAGKLVKRYAADAGSVQYTIYTSDIISRAVYMLKINVGNTQIYSGRVFKN